MKEETPALAPPTPSLDCVHLKEHILRLRWIFPTKQKLHIKSWISRLSIKAQTDRLHKEFSRSFFFCRFSKKTKDKKLIPDRFPAAFMFSLKLPQKKTIYRRWEPWQAPQITSLTPTAVVADVLSHRGVTDSTGAAGVESGTRILL